MSLTKQVPLWEIASLILGSVKDRLVIPPVLDCMITRVKTTVRHGGGHVCSTKYAPHKRHASYTKLFKIHLCYTDRVTVGNCSLQIQ
jgi:hypothetical protein